MAINKKLIHFEKFENFNSKKLSANKENTKYTLGVDGSIQTGYPEILYQSIVYIKDTKQQWTHGQLYNCSDSENQLKTYTFYQYDDQHQSITITQEELEKIQNADIVYFSDGTTNIQLTLKEESSFIYFQGYNLSNYPYNVKVIYVTVREDLQVIVGYDDVALSDYISDLVNGSESSYVAAVCEEIVNGAYVEIVENQGSLLDTKPTILVLTTHIQDSSVSLFGPYIQVQPSKIPVLKFIGEYNDQIIECVFNLEEELSGTLHIKSKSEGVGGDLSNYATKEELNTKQDNIADLETIRTNANIGANSYSWSILDYEYVDLGLPSGLLWATCNVGATKPEEYGGYYAWGETEEKEDYSWETYKWCDGSQTTLTKYCTRSSWGTIDNKTVLDLEDDVAHVKWGDNWRMPTNAELNELINNCTCTWTTLNGVSGHTVTGTNGNSIFLPEAGYRVGTELYSRGSEGMYWSSQLHANLNYHAHHLHFLNTTPYQNFNERYTGRSVRPVYRINTASSVEGETLIINSASYSNDTIEIYEKEAIVDNEMLIL